MPRHRESTSPKTGKLSRLRKTPLSQAIALALSTGLAAPVAAVDRPLSPPPAGLFENPFSGTGTIPFGTNAINYAQTVFDNHGDIRNRAELTNAGTLNNNTGGKIESPSFDGGFFNQSSGTLNNDGVISGTLTNAGMVNNAGSLSGGFGGGISNAGTLNNAGSLIGGEYGSISNAGTLNNNTGGKLSSRSVDDGFFNQSSGTLNNDGVIGGPLTNAGTLNNNTGGKIVAPSFDGEFFNQSSGTLNNDGVISGTLTNAGTLNNDGRLSGSWGASLSNAGTLNNAGSVIWGPYANFSNAGTLNNAGSLSIHDAGIANSGTLNNEGSLSIVYDGGIANSGTLNNAGSLSLGLLGAISNAGTGTLNNDGSLGGGHKTHISNAGTLNNAGSLSGGSDGRISNTGTLNNAGSIEHTGQFVNTGSITGSGTFIQNQNPRPQFFDVSLVNNGLLSASTVRFNGGVLAGNGTVASPNAIEIGAGAMVTPGDPNNDPTGTLTFEGDLDSAGTWAFEFENSSDFDVVSILGDAEFQFGSEVEFLFDFDVATGDVFTFLLADTVTGFENITFEATGLDLPFQVTEFNGDLSVRVVPVPAALPLFGSALLLVAGFARRRRRLGSEKSAAPG